MRGSGSLPFFDKLSSLRLIECQTRDPIPGFSINMADCEQIMSLVDNHLLLDKDQIRLFTATFSTTRAVSPEALWALYVPSVLTSF